MNILWRILGGSLSLPTSLALGAMHRGVLGPSAVLDLRVKRVVDVMDRVALVHRLRRTALDPSVAGVLLRLQEAPGGYAACHDLRTAIATVRRSGKPVYAFVEAPGNALVWIASACDRVFALPTGEIGLVGLGVEMTFFGAALEKLGLTPDFEAAGAYKSFGEPFTRSFPSAANQEAMGELIHDLHRGLVEDIAAGRKLGVEQVQELMARSPMSAQEALDGGLVDQLRYEDQVESWIEEQHGKRSKLVGFAGWARSDRWQERVDHWGEGGKVVAVLHFDGSIVMDNTGGGASPTIAARKVVPILRSLREDDRVAAVVLHVNSPGGDATASDLMWREVDAMKDVKPVVACFEDVAASGGFYLSAPANEILARPTTLTGSIGVFGGKIVAGEGLRKVGVHVHELAEAPNATMLSPHKPFTDGQRERFRSMLQRFYDGFVERVAAGRDQTYDEVEPHCRGRVWTGRHAHERKLIDRYGDVHDAVDRARALAGLHHGGFVRADLSCNPRTYLEKQIEQMVKRVNPLAAMAESWLPASLRVQIQLAMENPTRPLAMLPFDLKVR